MLTKNGSPAIYYRVDFVESGGLMSFGADRAEPYRSAASIVDKLLKGTNLPDTPVEQPSPWREHLMKFQNGIVTRLDRKIKGENS